MLSAPTSLSLSALRRGQKALITAIAPDRSGNDMHLRLHEMGFDEGIEIEVIHQGPFGGDPIAVSVDGVVIAIRRSEAATIDVTLLPDPVPAPQVQPAAELSGANL